ncbi:hypothetical protein CONLIGDRAFT_703255 [Coniochaeta ligniaria NRRL 30616]|uniref:Uncharacterized protein n=1 Tax=Coniochaeta ligniaria NRRL 30616 TaxID=1408157 RepID=A0A1J7J4W5_9PEZI|nr:hypothetical protein CONLIGDRAFT_703255 [Coniochaeta ligniaria NRRL 30616]
MSESPTEHELTVPATNPKPTLPEREPKQPQDAADASPTPAPACCKRVQEWTPDGHPIVDGKYLDSAGLIRSVEQGSQVTYGPPQVYLFWQNIYPVAGENWYFAVEKAFNLGTATECLFRLVEVLKRGGIEVSSLNVSRFSVILITHSPLRREQIMPMVIEARL